MAADGRIEYAIAVANDEFLGGLGEADRELQKFHGAAARPSPAPANVAGLGKSFIAVAGMVTAAAASVGGATAAFREFADQEALINGLRAVTREAGPLADQVERLKGVAAMPGLGFEEAVRGSIRLQAVGFSAQESEGMLMAFGNALASVGGGRAELDGVITALSQIQSKGKISAEEIMQLAERLPQVRTAMLAAFGTADSETLQRMGISARAFVTGLTTEFAKLPRVTGGLKNQMENLADSWKQLKVSTGELISPIGGALISVTSGWVEMLGKGADKLGELLGLTKQQAGAQRAAAEAARETAAQQERAANEIERAQRLHAAAINDQASQADREKAERNLQQGNRAKVGAALESLRTEERGRLPVREQISALEREISRLTGGRGIKGLGEKIRELQATGSRSDLQLAADLAAALEKAIPLRRELEDLQAAAQQAAHAFLQSMDTAEGAHDAAKGRLLAGAVGAPGPAAEEEKRERPSATDGLRRRIRGARVKAGFGGLGAGELDLFRSSLPEFTGRLPSFTSPGERPQRREPRDSEAATARRDMQASLRSIDRRLEALGLA